jgi:NADH-quinone oxidoreductase subunit C
MEFTDIGNSVSILYGEWLKKYGEIWKDQITTLKTRFQENITEVLLPVEYPTDVPIFFVKKQNIVDFLAFLKNEPGFEYVFLSDITATDEGGDLRFNVIYSLYSHKSGSRVRVKVRLKESEEIPSIASLWEGANWAEREVWDMYGVRFTGHPGLRRILMDNRWVGHPLRKDYPLDGYQVFPDAEPSDPSRLK